MYWKDLRKLIVNECKAHKKTSEYAKEYIAYCKNLFDQNLPIISSPSHFSALAGMDHEYVCRMAYSPIHFYRHFTIQKANGEMRDIYEPLPDLKYIQHWILTNILEKIPVSPYAKAFVKKKGVKENARFHRGQTVVVTMDIKDFFPSITIRSITDIFLSFGYYDNVANFLAHLCCLDYSLPQGAPTSPYLSNIRMAKFDERVAEYVCIQKIRYTRYADDLTFSGDFDPHQLIVQISGWLFKEGFTANTEKTRVARSNARQEVTGIVVNSHMQIQKAQRKKIRQEVYYIKKYGLESHLSHIGESRQNYLNHLLGKINYACYINPKDQELMQYYYFIHGLLMQYKTQDT